MKEQVKREVKEVKRNIKRVNDNYFLRNLVLAVCAVVVFLFISSLFLKLVTRHGSSTEIPDLRGLSIEAAQEAAKQASVKIEVSDSLYIPAYDGGVVLEQSPEPNSKVKRGRRVFLTVNSYTQKMTKVPYVTGFSLRQAKNNLEIAGLEIDKIVYQNDLASNYVLEQRYKGRTVNAYSNLEIPMGSGITLIVGRGDVGSSPAPRLVGLTLKEAKSRLWEVGLNIGKVDADSDVTPFNMATAIVYLQIPEQKTYVSPGGEVSVKLSLDEARIKKGVADSDKNAKHIVATQPEEPEQTEETTVDEQ